MMATKKKSFNTELDDLFSDVVLPSDEEVREETGKVKRAEGVRANRHKISEGGKRAYQDPARLEKQKTAMKNRDNSSHKEAGKKRAADPEWQAKQKAAIEALQNDPVRLAEYKKNYAKGNSKKYDNPEYWENYYKGIAKRDADEEYTKKRLDASRAKICKKVHTPLGVFDSITAASKAHGMGNSETMRHRIKSPNFPDFYIVEQ
jgi:hypothetical protein